MADWSTLAGVLVGGAIASGTTLIVERGRLAREREARAEERAIVAKERHDASQREALARCSELVVATQSDSNELVLSQATPGDPALVKAAALRMHEHRAQLVAWLSQLEDEPARDAIMVFYGATVEMDRKKMDNDFMGRRNNAAADALLAVSARLKALNAEPRGAAR